MWKIIFVKNNSVFANIHERHRRRVFIFIKINETIFFYFSFINNRFQFNLGLQFKYRNFIETHHNVFQKNYIIEFGLDQTSRKTNFHSVGKYYIFIRPHYIFYININTPIKQKRKKINSTFATETNQPLNT